MRTLHLFAGAGGGLLADLILGHTPVAAVEWDAYCCQVLRERAEEGWFPGLRVHEGDVRLFDPSEYAGRVDCIHAGFPCQDISAAGRQAGVGEGTRSGLYREVLRVADVVRPRYMFLENVAAILGNGLGTVLGDLAARGYDCRWTCVSAAVAGAPHQRDRWWLVADTNKDGGAESTGPAFVQWPVLAETGWAETSNRSCVSSDGATDVADASYSDVEGPRLAIGIQEERNSTGRASWWSIEPDLGRVDNGVASRVDRLKALGNGQVPLQAAIAWRIIMGTMGT